MSTITVERVNAANGLKLPVYTTDPVTATSGDIYYNSTTQTIRVFYNGVWNNIVP
jgi:hypothetical protein